ncbi:MAG: hypothetical protein AB7Q17_09270 [Phycisphaerae bacterium]
MRSAQRVAFRTGGAGTTIRIGALAGLLVGIVGCANQRFADERMGARVRGARYPVAMWSEREQQSPRNLALADQHLRRELARDAENTRRTPARVSAAWNTDADRWRTAQPVIVHEVRERLWGNPEEIEDIAIRLFY